MLQVVREMAQELAEQAGEARELRERHAAAFLHLAEQAAPLLTRTGRRAWLDLLQEESGNLREALTAVLEAGDADKALRLVAALWRFWQMRGQVHEGRRRAREALALAGGGQAQRIGALLAAGGMAYWQVDMPAAQAAYDQALELARSLAEPGLLARAQYNAAFPRAFQDRGEESLELFTQALAAARELGDSALEAEVLWGIGTAHWYRGEKPAAEPWYDRALEKLAGTEEAFTQGWSHRMRGVVRLDRRALEEARSDLQLALSMFAADRDVPGIVLLLRDFAELALAGGDPERALRLAGAAAGLEAASQTAMLEFAQNQIAGLAEAAAGLGRERAEGLLAEGRLMSLEQALAYVRL
jgi:tetratricopeptide (TPR) repeat protein